MFTKPGTYPACGMFNISHYVALVICLTCVISSVVLTRKITKDKMNSVTKITAVFITFLEVVKIVFNLYCEGFTYINNIIPLHFCSLFIYSLWMAGFGKGFFKKVGESFLSGACIVAGLFFLIMPTSSFLIFPIFHFQCLHSLLFHSLMLYFGLMYFIKGFFDLNIKNYVYYVVFCSIFGAVAFLFNEITALVPNINTANLMFLREPWGLPLEFLHKIHSVNPYLYSLCIFFAYAVLVYFATLFAKKLILTIKDRKKLC